ncbi:MAG: RagB/SusD family nutrient uptake outer membrane protein [Bacteroidales bacterium]|nr:RagB/SusD family nutrient uptake outer membrane protein [Bacteroidales bacterium]
MKRYILTCFLVLSFAVCSCDMLLEKAPTSQISPEKYLNEASQLGYYANGLYTSILPSHSGYSLTFVEDQYTDNQAFITPHSMYLKDSWTVPASGSWYFKNIYDCNYFLEKVLPKFEKGEISGSTADVCQYIGEVYFLRAYEYFVRYQQYGDLPIVTKTLPDDQDVLTEASRRFPRNEVARFILSDLDKALEIMPEQFESRHTRINRNCVLLLKSRVALYEGTFLKYFKGTGFVPQGDGWPGAQKEYSASYQYPLGSIDDEINWFLDQAVIASEALADKVVLTANTGTVQQSAAESANPYMDMFSSTDLSGYPEVLLWRQYDKGLGFLNACGEWGNRGNLGAGLTRGMVDCFLMANGLPIYAAGSGYKGDDYIADVKVDRDGRLKIFLKEPGQVNCIDEFEGASQAVPVEPYPNLFGSDFSRVYSTGYSIRKGNPLNQIHLVGIAGSYVASISFRGVEAMLNYMEAYYERHGSLDAKSISYWEAIRERAKVDTNVNKTIDATDMTLEAKNDWGAYSAGKLVDPVLYNIRRERRCELMAEGLRTMDLQRWRSLDQLITEPYHIEGFKIWGPMKGWYGNQLKHGTPDANVSSPSRSQYLRPYEKTETSEAYDGLTFAMAHYLYPIAIQEMILTSSDDGADNSVIYQNPYWPVEAGEPAIQ